MNLNSINIQQIILMSRMKLSFKDLLIRNLSIFTFSICAASLFFSHVLHQNLPWTAWIGASGCLAIKTLGEIAAYKKMKYQANKELTALAKYLNQEGIDVSRISLKKSIVAEKVPSQVIHDYGISAIKENVAVFKDRKENLMALKQVRSELVQQFREPTSEDIIDGNYVEIVRDSKQVEKILAKMRMRRNI